jgi:hypothetical protein
VQPLGQNIRRPMLVSELLYGFLEPHKRSQSSMKRSKQCPIGNARYQARTRLNQGRNLDRHCNMSRESSAREPHLSVLTTLIDSQLRRIFWPIKPLSTGRRPEEVGEPLAFKCPNSHTEDGPPKPFKGIKHSRKLETAYSSNMPTLGDHVWATRHLH